MASVPRPLDTDDLDELDDVLEQFSRQPEPQSATSEVGAPTSPLTSPGPPPPTATVPSFTTGRPRTNTRVDAPPIPLPGNGLAGVKEDEEADVDADAIAADFAAELAKGMESLMKEISEGGQGADGSGSGSAAQMQPELKAAWEALLVEGMAAGASAGSGAEGADAASNDFQAKIKAAMGKLKEGEDAMKGSGGAGSEDPLAAMLAALGGEGGDGDLQEAELAGLLENMMGELMSKEFPPYLENPPTPLAADERKRYEEQLERVQTIITLFEKPEYSDEDSKARESVVALMAEVPSLPALAMMLIPAEMQSFGSPPAELMGPMPPGLDMLGQDGCVVC
ncbi:hypothetical protein MKEN_01128100 [Mycena kentingensis (nom. inval.)]|nr:hypothetical protein MKEN_01128100 [Mycena kentingensis (nom. inval.)]